MKWIRAHLRLALIGSLCSTAPSLHAQETSPINDLLVQARNALNDLKYAKADTIAQDVLSLGDRLRRPQRILALQVRAAAAYPETGGERNADAARSALHDVVALDLDAQFPDDIRWTGLEALLGEVKQTTFGLAVRVRKEYQYGGDAGPATIRVVTSQPSRIVLRATPRDGGRSITLDSVGVARDTTLRLTALQGVEPVLPTGAWTIEAEATSAGAGSTQVRVRRFAATSTASRLVLVPSVPPIDASQLRVEKTRTSPVAGVLGVLAFVGGSIGISSALKPDAPLGGSGWSGDKRATSVALLGAAGAAVALLLDQGRPIAANVAHNCAVRAAYADAVRTTQDENARRSASFRALLAIDVEDR